jgi:hypothetical protein
MSRVDREANLARLCQDLRDYSRTQVPRPAEQTPGLAERLSKSVFLANSSKPEKFEAICSTGYIASLEFLARGGEPVDPLKCEAVLGTSGDVFFYLAPFRYPRTACGLLFSGTLEDEHQDDGVGTPFDSGGLHRHLRRRDPLEPARTFLDRHELPIPQHREYLENSMRFLFRSPKDYVEGIGPFSPGPLGLSSGDEDSRRWTHEVRLPGRVFLRSGHLQAVFASRSVIGASRPVEELFKWCAREGVDNIPFDNPSGDDFGELKRRCLEYMKEHIY